MPALPVGALFRALSAQIGAKGVVPNAKHHPEKPAENLELSSDEDGYYCIGLEEGSKPLSITVEDESGPVRIKEVTVGVPDIIEM